MDNRAPESGILKPWALRESELFSRLNSSPNGLSGEEALSRLKRFGPNEIKEKDRKTALSIMFSQFENPLIYLLVFAAVVSLYLGSVAEGAVILVIVALNSGLGFLQEYRAEESLRHLKKLVSFSAEVVRGGVKMQVDAREVVLGDVVFVHIGDKVPADFRVLSCEEFEVDESALTGESMPVAKKPGVLKGGDLPAAEISNVAFMGTTVSSGHASGVVVASGEDSFFGKTARVLSARVPRTSFEERIREFGELLLRLTFAMTVFVFLVNALFGRGVLDSFLFAIALAVGITPEALPMIITVALSSGALALAKRKVVVKKLVVMENLGNMDVLCLDKTGTLTENVLELEQALSLEGGGAFSEAVLEKALLCSTVPGAGVHARARNAFDAAVWNFAEKKFGAQKASVLSKRRVVETIDFDFNRRRMSVVEKRGSKNVLVTKGAWESVLLACTKEACGGKICRLRASTKRKLENYAKQGYSVLAVASRELSAKKNYSEKDERELCLGGVLLFAAPAKKTASRTVLELEELGVQLKILTGDGQFSTQKLCQDVNFPIAQGRVVLGSELQGLSQEEFKEWVDKYNVFARVTPEQKFATVLALREKGHVVGFMGDGVNDAPALRASDVGISVDNAVDVAKDAAHIILLHKSLESVHEGVVLGRRIFGNITKYLFNTMSANFGNMFTIAASSVFLKFIPLLPRQILLNNLLSDVPLLALPSDNVDKAFLKKPRKWDLNLVTQFMLRFGLLSFAFDLITIFSLLFWLQSPQDAFRTAWFLESVLSEIIITFAIRTQKPFWQSAPSFALAASSVIVAGASVALLYSPFAHFFELTPLPLEYLALISGILLAYFAAAEFLKARFFKKFAF